MTARSTIAALVESMPRTSTFSQRDVRRFSRYALSMAAIRRVVRELVNDQVLLVRRLNPRGQWILQARRDADIDVNE